jgi:hypothetical protein
MVTLENDFLEPVEITVGGHTYTLARYQQVGPLVVTPAMNGEDFISTSVVGESTCSVSHTSHFASGGTYWVWSEFMVGGTFFCPGNRPGVSGGQLVPGPDLEVTTYGPAPPLSAT